MIKERNMTLVLNEDLPEYGLMKGTRFMCNHHIPDTLGHLAVWDEFECARQFTGPCWHLHHSYFTKLPEPVTIPVQP